MRACSIRWVVLAVAFACGGASAKEAPLLDISKGDFEAQRSVIEKAVVSGDEYREISPGDRKQVLEGLIRIGELLGGADSDELTSLNEARNAAFALQATINESLARAATDSRLVCTREHVIGSNRPKTICLTVAAKRRAFERTQERLGAGRRPVSTPGEQL